MQYLEGADSQYSLYLKLGTDSLRLWVVSRLPQRFVHSPNPDSAYNQAPLSDKDGFLSAAWNWWQVKLQDMRESINLISSGKVILLGWEIVSLEKDGLKIKERIRFASHTFWTVKQSHRKENREPALGTRHTDSSVSGHMPGFRDWSLVWGVQKAADQ